MNLRNRFERFCFRNRDKGIPNLMLYIVIGNALVAIMSLFNGGGFLYKWLCFDKSLILQGQVWRLFTFIFTQGGGSLLGLIFLYFFYMLGRHVEISMGSFRFNLYYLSGIILMAGFGMIFCPTEPVMYGGELYAPQAFVNSIYSGMGFYLHLSLMLTYATMYPDSQFLILFIIPVKAWVIALFDLILTAAEIFNLSYPVLFFPHNLFPLIGILNYLLFAGKDVRNLFPFLQYRRKVKYAKQKPQGPIPFRQKNDSGSKKAEANYNHRCTVCGRTDVSNPELEFRYCSRCNGYHCYCQDHINDHIHIQ